MISTPDLNCDLGEGEAPSRTAELMEWVDSVSIACGGHAGDVESMTRCLRWAARMGVRAGAHPGLPSRADFGRGSATLCDGAELRALLRGQVGCLAEAARSGRVRLFHVKLHGALYHEVESSPALAEAYVEEVAFRWPGLVVFGRCGGEVLQAADRLGIESWAEGFLDRRYRDDGGLVPRGEPGALIKDTGEVVRRARDIRERGGCWSIGGRWVPLAARTLCVHGDSPGAVEMLRAVRAAWGIPPRAAG